MNRVCYIIWIERCVNFYCLMIGVFACDELKCRVINYFDRTKQRLLNVLACYLPHRFQAPCSIWSQAYSQLDLSIRHWSWPWWCHRLSTDSSPIGSSVWTCSSAASHTDYFQSLSLMPTCRHVRLIWSKTPVVTFQCWSSHDNEVTNNLPASALVSQLHWFCKLSILW